MVKGRRIVTVAMILAAMTLFLVKEVYQPSKATYNNIEKDASNAITFEARVIRVIDGDTVIIDDGNAQQTVRFIGIDAPEKEECYFKESTERLRDVVENRRVLVVTDPTQDREDMYKRLLAYVYLEDGTLLNQMMIDDGVAREYTYRTAYQFQSEFTESEIIARSDAKGLWSVCQ